MFIPQLPQPLQSRSADVVQQPANPLHNVAADSVQHAGNPLNKASTNTVQHLAKPLEEGAEGVERRADPLETKPAHILQPANPMENATATLAPQRANPPERTFPTIIPPSHPLDQVSPKIAPQHAQKDSNKHGRRAPQTTESDKSYLRGSQSNEPTGTIDGQRTATQPAKQVAAHAASRKAQIPHDESASTVGRIDRQPRADGPQMTLESKPAPAMPLKPSESPSATPSLPSLKPTDQAQLKPPPKPVATSRHKLPDPTTTANQPPHADVKASYDEVQDEPRTLA
jgi:hypothetical protein